MESPSQMKGVRKEFPSHTLAGNNTAVVALAMVVRAALRGTPTWDPVNLITCFYHLEDNSNKIK